MTFLDDALVFSVSRWVVVGGIVQVCIIGPWKEKFTEHSRVARLKRHSLADR